MARGARVALRVKWSRDARADQQRIWLFLAERSANHADMVEALIEAKAPTLARFPGLGRRIPNTTLRCLSVTDIQYTIDYELEDDAVRILRVRSTRQNREKP